MLEAVGSRREDQPLPKRLQKWTFIPKNWSGTIGDWNRVATVIASLFVLLSQQSVSGFLPRLLDSSERSSNVTGKVQGEEEIQEDGPVQEDKAANDPESRKMGHLVRVPMPISSQSANRVMASVNRVLDKVATETKEQRPILVMEFDNRNGATGSGSSFEDSLKLARFLTGPQLSKVRTIAYLPGASNVAEDLFDSGKPKRADFVGHAILVILSCEDIVMHKQAAIGNAGIDVDVVDDLLINAYRTIAEKRRVIPTPVALSMLDKSMTVLRAELKPDGVKYVTESEFAELDADGKIVSSQTIADVNNFGFFTSEDWQAFRLIRHRVDSRTELADRFLLRESSLESDPSLGDGWKAIRIVVDGVVSDRSVTWIENALTNRVEAGDINLVIVDIDSAGGKPEAAVRLANRLSEFDPNQVRTIAFISQRARGAASVIAMGCDAIVMKSDAVIGGPGRPELSPQQLISMQEAIKELAKRKETTWSLGYGLVDPQFEVMRWKQRKTGRYRLMSDAEKEAREDADLWDELQSIDLASGLDGTLGENLGLVRNLVESFEEFKSIYQLTDEPDLLEPTLTDRWVERLARRLASPQIAWLVLFGAIFFLSTEFSNPGLGVPGFLSAICWMLFFWSQYFDGNATVLEILLFLIGIVFILIEFFVLPGLGIFGVGGALMVAASLVLAVQTFVIPSNPEEFRQLTTSLLTFAVASSGFFVAVFLFRRYIGRLPMLRGMALQPEGVPGDLENRQVSEALVDFSLLEGRTGITQTKLMPSGKAVIGGELYNVITDGRMIENETPIVVRQVVGNIIEVGVDQSRS